MDNFSRQGVIRLILADVEQEISDQEMLRLLVETTVTESFGNERLGLGHRAADILARGAGSWAFMFSFIAFWGVWIAMNVVLAQRAFDAFPFILLSCSTCCCPVLLRFRRL